MQPILCARLREDKRSAPEEASQTNPTSLSLQTLPLIYLRRGDRHYHDLPQILKLREHSTKARGNANPTHSSTFINMQLLEILLLIKGAALLCACASTKLFGLLSIKNIMDKHRRSQDVKLVLKRTVLLSTKVTGIYKIRSRPGSN